MLGPLHPDCQQQLLQLLVPWREAAAALAATLQESDSSSDAMVASLLKDCRTLLEHVTKQQQQQQEDKEEEEQLGQGQHAGHVEGACNSAAAAAAVSGVAAAPVGPDQASGSSNGRDTHGSAAEPHEAAAVLASAADTLCQRMSMIASCLVLQFIEGSCTPTGAEASAAWQQTVPLQVLLLSSQLQQLHGAMQRCVSQLQESSEPQQQQQQEQQQEGAQAASPQQQPEQLQQSDAAQAPAAAAAAAAPGQYLTAVLQHVVSLLQSIRRFKTVNEAMGSTATDGSCDTPAGVAPDAASSRTQASNSSSNSSSSSQGHGCGCMKQPQVLDPFTFFSAGGPLAGGVWGFQQPAGAGVWAQVDAVPAEVGPQQHQQHQQQLVASARHAGSSLAGQQSSSSSAATALAAPQQAWQVLLGCCVWQQALQHMDESLVANLTPPTESLFGHLERRLFRFIRDVSATDRLATQAYLQQFQSLGIDGVNMHEALRVCAVPHVLEELVEVIRVGVLEKLGFDDDTWRRRRLMRTTQQLRKFAVAQRLESAGYGTRRDGTLVFSRDEVEKVRVEGVLKPDEDPATLQYLHMWDPEDELDIRQREIDADTGVVKEAHRRINGIDAELEELAKMFDGDDTLAGAAASGTGCDSNGHGGGQAAGAWGSGTSNSGSSSPQPPGTPRALPSASDGQDSNTADGSLVAAASVPAAVAAAAAATTRAGSSWVLPEEVTKGKQAVRWVSVE
jgi:hypothetical protein